MVCLLKAYEDLQKLECQQQLGREKVTTVQDTQKLRNASKVEAITCLCANVFLLDIQVCFIQIGDFSGRVTEEILMAAFLG